MQIIHITQLIKKPLNKLERFFKKACDYRFFVCISRITSIFVVRLFFRKRFSHVSIVIHVEICKKISVAITNGFFCTLIFTFNTMFTFWEISTMFQCGVYCNLSKWVIIFENFYFLHFSRLFLFSKILGFFSNENAVKLDFSENRLKYRSKRSLFASNLWSTSIWKMSFDCFFLKIW